MASISHVNEVNLHDKTQKPQSHIEQKPLGTFMINQ